MRAPLDAYATPSWVVHRLLDVIDLSKCRTALEPCHGTGAVVDACKTHPHGKHLTWDTNDIQGGEDYLKLTPADLYDVIITNPPYSKAFEFVQKAVREADIVCMLLRVNFLASGKRADWLMDHRPNVYILPNRPSFTGGGTDATDYAWFVWGQPLRAVQFLPRTPLKSRTTKKPKAIAA